MISPDHFPLVEYDTRPVSSGFDKEQGRYLWPIWQHTQTIDLRWVAAAAPWETEFTEIHLCGAGLQAGIIIRAAYADFMRDWTRAKRM